MTTSATATPLKQRKNRQSPKAAEFFRKRINFDENRVSGLVFKIADTRDELEQAYKLVHDVYAEKGYIEPQPHGLHLKLSNALPTTTTFVGKLGDRVVTTLTLFLDSPLGLPLDELYKTEADALRSQKNRLSEVGSLASVPEFRDNSPQLMLYITRVAIHYALRYLKSDYSLITVHPKHQSFYEHILLFEPIGEVMQYKAVNENPAVLLKLDLKAASQNYHRVYHEKPIDKNLHDFIFVRPIACIQLPEVTHPANVWTEKLLDWFFWEKTSLFKTSGRKQLDCIKSEHIKYHTARLERLFDQTTEHIGRLCACIGHG